MITNPDNHPIMGGSGVCECLNQYSFEPHGDGFALYFGRCDHRHGYNLGNIKEPDKARMKAMVEQLNVGIRYIALADPKAPTPRTDSALHGVWYRGDHGSAIPALCRQLELELASLKGSHDEAWKRVAELDLTYQKVLDERDQILRELDEYREAWRLDKARMMEAQIDSMNWREMARTLANAYTSPDSGITEVEGAVYAFSEMEKKRLEALK